MSLRARILLLVLFATLTPAVVPGLLFFEHRNREIDEAKHALGALAKYAAENLDGKVKGTAHTMFFALIASACTMLYEAEGSRRDRLMVCGESAALTQGA